MVSCGTLAKCSTCPLLPASLGCSRDLLSPDRFLLSDVVMMLMSPRRYDLITVMSPLFRSCPCGAIRSPSPQCSGKGRPCLTPPYSGGPGPLGVQGGRVLPEYGVPYWIFFLSFLVPGEAPGAPPRGSAPGHRPGAPLLGGCSLFFVAES